MNDQVRMERNDGKFAVVLYHHGSHQFMDKRDTFDEAKDFAYYLARSMKLDVYYEGKKL